MPIPTLPQDCTNLKKIIWTAPEETLLVLSVEKYGKDNWYKIVSNLYSTHTHQAKSRWKGWSHPMLKKRNWNLREDTTLYYQARTSHPSVAQKFTGRYRTPWQCFFRSTILHELQTHLYSHPFAKLPTSYLGYPSAVLRTFSHLPLSPDTSPLPFAQTEGLTVKLVCITGKKNVKKKGKEKFRNFQGPEVGGLLSPNGPVTPFVVTLPHILRPQSRWQRTFHRMLEGQLTLSDPCLLRVLPITFPMAI